MIITITNAPIFRVFLARLAEMVVGAISGTLASTLCAALRVFLHAEVNCCFLNVVLELSNSSFVSGFQVRLNKLSSGAHLLL